jgi:hypothetical protein
VATAKKLGAATKAGAAKKGGAVKATPTKKRISAAIEQSEAEEANSESNGDGSSLDDNHRAKGEGTTCYFVLSFICIFT